MVFWHIGQQLPNVLFALLSPENILVVLVCLQLDNDLGDGPLEVESRSKTLVVALRKLLLAELDAINGPELVLD